MCNKNWQSDQTKMVENLQATTIHLQATTIHIQAITMHLRLYMV